MVFLGLSVLTFLGGRAPNSAARQAIALGVGVVMLGLSIMGTYELVRGFVNTGILFAIIIELVVATSYFCLWFCSRQPTA